jgi:hypothetical protein
MSEKNKKKKMGCFGDFCPGGVLGLVPGVNVLCCGMNCSGFASFLPKVPWPFNQDTDKKRGKFVIRALKSNNPNDFYSSFEWFDKLQQNEKDSLTFGK